MEKLQKDLTLKPDESQDGCPVPAMVPGSSYLLFPARRTFSQLYQMFDHA
jgi:hypothetical protein